MTYWQMNEFEVDDMVTNMTENFFKFYNLHYFIQFSSFSLCSTIIFIRTLDINKLNYPDNSLIKENLIGKKNNWSFFYLQKMTEFCRKSLASSVYDMTLEGYVYTVHDLQLEYLKSQLRDDEEKEKVTDQSFVISFQSFLSPLC